MPYTIDVVIKERADLAARLVVVERERDEAWEQLAQAGVGPYLGDYYLGKLTVTGQLRADNARLREALEEIGVIANTAYKYSNDTRCTAHCLSIMEQARAAQAQTGGAS